MAELTRRELLNARGATAAVVAVASEPAAGKAGY